MNGELLEKIERSNAYACLECGKCTSVCPVSLFRRNTGVGRQYSPRAMLTKTIRQKYDAVFSDYDLWSCLSCRRCDDYCPSEIHYVELVQTLRTAANRTGLNGKCSHSGALQSLSRLMTSENLKQNRLNWIGDDLKTSESSDVLYFVGCAPYFDAFFTNLDLNTLEAARSSVKLLNRLGISPAVLPDERCCGHDLWWNGDIENFEILAKKNVAQIEKTGAETILFSCAECLSSFKNLYPNQGLSVNAELKHMSQFLAEKMSSNELKLAKSDTTFTYHDPCRLGRHLGIYEEPRQILASMANSPKGSPVAENFSRELKEMKQHGKRSLCCGVSAWMNCDTTSKTIQTERLRQAKQSGAGVLAVACPKCQIHLICTMKDKSNGEDYPFKIRDISSIALDRMETS